MVEKKKCTSTQSQLKAVLNHTDGKLNTYIYLMYTIMLLH